VAQQLAVFVGATDAVRRFAHVHMVPVLLGQLQLSDEETPVVGTYLRMYQWIVAMCTLNDWRHYQPASAAARALFELGLDLQLLIADPTPNSAGQFHDFTEVERFRIARNCVEYCDSNAGACSSRHPAMRALLADATRVNRVQRACLKHGWTFKKGRNSGRPRPPGHWTARDTRARARLLDRLLGTSGHEASYVEDYSRLSWYVHPGFPGVAGVSAEGFQLSFIMAHAIATRLFMEATLLCAKRMHIDKVIPRLEAELGWWRAQAMLSALEEGDYSSRKPEVRGR
jgi:hypothetical protein